ncbi:hypothetical protein ACFYVR_15890 [Rhodococcus sp. NPDC003318]|uniref:hypothetical protein n=1 Tax=Rhodococcus sp. NPDC003318 TaxID=3364503 RepID=UPI0036CF1C45
MIDTSALRAVANDALQDESARERWWGALAGVLADEIDGLRAELATRTEPESKEDEVSPKTFRKKPVEIEAMQWDGAVRPHLPIASWIRENGGVYRWSPSLGGRQYLQIETLEGVMTCSPGDWVIRGVKGEFYPCKPDIFEATYEEVSHV